MQVTLATPDKHLFKSEAVESVKLQAAKGEVEILPGHTRLISLVQAGPVLVKLGGGAGSVHEKKFEVSEGVLKVDMDQISILCQRAAEV